MSIKIEIHLKGKTSVIIKNSIPLLLKIIQILTANSLLNKGPVITSKTSIIETKQTLEYLKEGYQILDLKHHHLRIYSIRHNNKLIPK